MLDLEIKTTNQHTNIYCVGESMPFMHAGVGLYIYIYIYRIHMYANRVTIMFHVNRKPAKFPMLQNIKHLFDDGPMKTSDTRVIWWITVPQYFDLKNNRTCELLLSFAGNFTISKSFQFKSKLCTY
jgi:hypothetical protein